MVVLKFGGSSVATAAAIGRVADIVAGESRPRAVVVSALGGVTERLLELARLAGAGRRAATARVLDQVRARHRDAAHSLETPSRRDALLADLDDTWRQAWACAEEAARESSCTPACRDAIVASGEVASSRLVAAWLSERGLRAACVDARRVMVTDRRHGNAAPDVAATRALVRAALLPRLDAGEVPVLGGFIGATADGVTTTLGRGGSDYSASLIGACLDAAEIQIWTDTDGVLTADPRVVPAAQTVARLSYGEAAALAYFGATVLHPSTVGPAVATSIPVRVLNAGRPAAAGTLISARPCRRQRQLAGLAWRTGFTLICVDAAPTAARTATLATLILECQRTGASVQEVLVSAAGVAILIDGGTAANDVAAAAAAMGPVQRHDGLASVAVVGDGLARDPKLCAAVLRACRELSSRSVTHAADAGYLRVTLAQRRLGRVLAALHRRFFECGDDGQADDVEVSTVLPDRGRPGDGPEVWA